MFYGQLKPSFNVKYVKSVTLEAFVKNHEDAGYDKKMLEKVWNEHNPKKEDKK